MVPVARRIARGKAAITMGVAAVALVSIVVLIRSTADNAPELERLSLPLETQPPSDFYMQALTGGTLRFEARGSVVCSYLDSTRVVWPAGFQSNDGKLLDADGTVVAAAGETIQVGGGGTDSPLPGPCGRGWTWLAS